MAKNSTRGAEMATNVAKFGLFRLRLVISSF
jgi:hypothetical protein